MEGLAVQALDASWEAAPAKPDTHVDPRAIDDLEWMPARVPGTAAGALRDAGLEAGPELDDQDWWFRTAFESAGPEPDQALRLCIGGIATLSEVFLNGERIIESDSMFAPHRADVSALLRDGNELAIRCRALGPELAVRRKPRARWRTQLADGNLRWFRTVLMGRAPGFAPSPPAVGPWRPVTLERSTGIAVDGLDLRARLDGEAGVLTVNASLTALAGESPASVAVQLNGPSGSHRAALALTREDRRLFVGGELRVPGAAPWWPHTHGEPALHDVWLVVSGAAADSTIPGGRVGFRTLAGGPRGDVDVERDGLDLHVNGVPVFCRGAVWTPLDLVGMAPAPAELRATLEAARDAGMNMLRIPGTSAYESAQFHDLCDELGILVWQDLMLANFDYPFADEGFRATAEDEARGVIERLAPRPSLAVLCGGSEVFQQAAMVGLDPEIAREPFYLETLPRLLEEAGGDAAYVPSAPCGGHRPFTPDRGIANYYGVGAYLRPLSDARLAGVRFAAECLAFANVPPGEEKGAFDRLAGVPRDVGTEWDFADVRDHYLGTLYRLDAAELAQSDPARYAELSRAVSGEVMAEVLGEWRRGASPCNGALLLWLRDILPGAGWGVLDHLGEPKMAYHHLRRALAPRAVWMTDEGLAGIAVHVANDRPEPLGARLRVTLYSDSERRVGEAHEDLQLPGRSSHERDAEELLGHFADIGWAYRFGPPAQDLIVASLEREGEGEGDQGLELISQAFRFPLGRPAAIRSDAGLRAAVRRGHGGAISLELSCDRYAHGARIEAPGFRPADDGFGIEPGGTRVVPLIPLHPEARFAGASVRALNLDGDVSVGPQEGP